MLLDLGLVERREIPPSSQFRLIRENVAAQAIAELARSRDTALDRIGTAAAALPFQPVSVIVFGSFARGLADEHSDLDAIIVRPDDVDEDDDAWSTAIERGGAMHRRSPATASRSSMSPATKYGPSSPAERRCGATSCETASWP